MTYTTTPTGLPDESDLVTAARELAELDDKTGEAIQPIRDRILAATPKTAIGAAITLRLLCDPDLGIDAPDAAMTALRRVLAIVEEAAAAEERFQRHYVRWREEDAEEKKRFAARQVLRNAGLARRLASAIADDGIRDVDQLLGLSAEQLQRIPNVGPVGREAIEALRVRMRGGDPLRVVEEAAQ